MKLLEVEILNVRGIVDQTLTANGKNLVIWGPNGSGKSAVVDALDFVLTGRVTRLEGSGTGKLKLDKHGPHIDSNPVDATVRAKMKLPGVEEPIDIKRCMASPSICEYDKSLKATVQPMLQLAKRGQHVLTRREILQFVTADPKTRAEGIQELLDAKEIESTRQGLVKAKNRLKTEHKTALDNLDTAKRGVASTVHQVRFDSTNTIEIINQNRQVLKGQPIKELHHTELKRGIVAPIAQKSGESVNVTIFEGQVQAVRRFLSSANKEIGQKDEDLRSFIASVKSNPALLRAYTQRQLIVLGRSLVDESGNCPLCEAEWPAGELSARLDERLSTADNAAKQQEHIRGLAQGITGFLKSLQQNIEKICSIAELAGFETEFPKLRAWGNRLKDLTSSLDEPLEKYSSEKYSVSQVRNLLAPNDIEELLTSLTVKIKKKYPASTPEQTAWDTLTGLVENLKVLERDAEKARVAELVYRRAVTVEECFEKARNKILGALYESVKDRFVEFYRFLHGPDEGSFGANLKPEGAALNFEVNFHGHGAHPPHALHSEGHQDSMGLCLYLALAERLTLGKIDLIILDDVMMSVDVTHRKKLCSLITEFFPERQFLITTHDTTWAYQLRHAGVVNKAGLIEFYNWNVKSGPSVNHETEMWEKIQYDLKKNDIPAAAGRLRRGSEQFFSSVCESLRARVIYRPDGRWDLGELLPAAITQYKKLLKDAKKSAQSWKNEEAFNALKELDSTAGQVHQKLSAEQWAINTSLHYNEWENLTQTDFLPVVQAFRDLYAHLICVSCGSVLYVTPATDNPDSLRCSCAKINWNLKTKPKT